MTAPRHRYASAPDSSGHNRILQFLPLVSSIARRCSQGGRSGLDFDSRIITEGLTRRATSEGEAAALRGAVTGWREIPEFKEHLLPVPETDRA